MLNLLNDAYKFTRLMYHLIHFSVIRLYGTDKVCHSLAHGCHVRAHLFCTIGKWVVVHIDLVGDRQNMICTKPTLLFHIDGWMDESGL